MLWLNTGTWHKVRKRQDLHKERRPIWSLWGCTINASGKYMHMENFEEYRVEDCGYKNMLPDPYCSQRSLPVYPYPFSVR